MSDETPKKLQVYICEGCDIGECIDTEKLAKLPAKEYKIDEAKRHPFLCGKEGVQLIQADVDEGVNRPVIAACSPRVLGERFDFGDDAIVERVNLREGTVWISEPKHEDTQMLAEDYLRIGIVKAKKTDKPAPFLEELEKSILVIGGGFAGLTAAVEAADAGYKIVLVEKEARLGGFAVNMKQRTPSGGAHDRPVEVGLQQKVSSVEAHENVAIFTSTAVASVAGQPGQFDVELMTAGGSQKLRVGAIVLATGWKPYDLAKVEHLGYGTVANVVSNIEFEKMAAEGKLLRPSDGKPVKSVAFVQCAGSRIGNHLPYCSSVCCMVSLKQAAYLRESDPDAKAYIFYKDIRTPGTYESFYKKMQDDEGVFLTKGEVTAVEGGDGDRPVVTAMQTLLGPNDVQVSADLVVLAGGMVTAAQNGGALNLTYLQGPELPELAHGFPDSHFICFPYETRRTGIYAAGAVRHPMDLTGAENDAVGAALKAIQCIELSARGKSVHPRVGDTSYPEIAMDRCTQCKRCTEECPYGMYDEDAKFNPVPNPLRCRRCGTCMGACPQRIISFKDYSVDMVSSMLKAIGVPEEEDEKPRVLALVCENDALPAFDMAGLERLRLNPFVRVISLRCIGSMSMIWLNDAFSQGIDGILLIGCKYGDDYQCHNMKGSELGKERLGKLEETLGRMQLEPERVKFVPLTINEYRQLPDILSAFMEKIDELGPNPFKEFGDFG